MYVRLPPSLKTFVLDRNERVRTGEWLTLCQIYKTSFYFYFVKLYIYAWRSVTFVTFARLPGHKWKENNRLRKPPQLPKKTQFIGFSFKFLKLYNPKVYSIPETFVFLTEKNTFRIFISSFYVAFPSCLRREDHICLFFSFHLFSSRGSTRTCHCNVNDPFSDLPFFVSEESICHEITNPF